MKLVGAYCGDNATLSIVVTSQNREFFMYLQDSKRPFNKELGYGKSMLV